MSERAVDALLDSLGHPQRSLIDALRAVVRDAVPDAREGIKWNAPSFAARDDFATFHLRARRGVQLVLHLGVKPRPDARVRAEIGDPHGLLEWRGADRAMVTFLDAEQLDASKAAFAAVLKQWVTYLG